MRAKVLRTCTSKSDRAQESSLRGLYECCFPLRCRYNHLLSASPAMWGSVYAYCTSYICHGADLPQVSMTRQRRAAIGTLKLSPPPTDTTCYVCLCLVFPPKLPSIWHHLHGRRRRFVLGYGFVLGQPRSDKHCRHRVERRSASRVAGIFNADESLIIVRSPYIAGR